jgi:hypothetical protein
MEGSFVAKARPEKMRQDRVRATLLLEQLLDGLAAEGFVERVIGHDGTIGYRITDAGSECVHRCL